MPNETDTPAAFLSYARNDDLHDRGRISALRRHLSEEVAMQIGEEFRIFQDRDNILVGEQWRERIDTSINGATILITIISPAFLKSENCRNEVRQFFERERRLGREDLVIPIVYVETSFLDDESDEIASNLKRRQLSNWTELRFADFESNEYRKDVALLAGHIVSAIERSRSAEPLVIQHESDKGSNGSDSDDAPGFVELMAEAEEAMGPFAETLQSIGSALVWFAEVTETATIEIQAAARPDKPSSTKLVAIRRYSRNLEEPVAEIERLADDYLDQLTQIGGGMDVLIGRIGESSDEEEIQAAHNLLESLDTLVRSSEETVESLGEFQSSLAENYKLSSTLRPRLRQMSAALEKIMPSRDVFVRWRTDLSGAIGQVAKADITEQ